MVVVFEGGRGRGGPLRRKGQAKLVKGVKAVNFLRGKARCSTSIMINTPFVNPFNSHFLTQL